MRRSGSTRIRPRPPEARRIDELRELLSHPKAVAVGETGLDTVTRPCDARRAAPAPGGASRARGGARASDRDPQPRSGRGDGESARGLSGKRCAPLLLVAGARPRGRRARVLRLVRRKRHVSERRRAAVGRDCDRARPHPRRDGQPVPRAAAGFVDGRTSRPTSSTRSTSLAEARGESFDELAAATHANAAAAFALP